MNLRKIDLHRHLDGSIRLQTILDLGRQFDVPLPARNIEDLRPHVVIDTPQPGLLAFLEKFQWMVGVLGDYDACQRVARENVEDAYHEGLSYVELRFSPVFMAKPFGLDPAGVTEAVIRGIREGAAEWPVEVRLIGILSRTYGVDSCWNELNALLQYHRDLVAIDLAGDEANFPARLFVPHFEKVREAGLAVTIHAGEADGPQSVWDAIRLLGATRIGHGIRSNEDPALMDYLVENRIALECCLTSNVQTESVASYAVHPLRDFLDRGILATINTDDPGISGITFDDELHRAAPAAGLNENHVTQALENAWKVRFST